MSNCFEQIGECEDLRKTIASLEQQLSKAEEQGDHSLLNITSQNQLETKTLHDELLNVKESSGLKYAKQKLLLQAQVTLKILCCGFIMLLHLN